MRIADALHAAEARVERLDARVLLCHVLGCSTAFLIAHPDDVLRDEQLAAYETFIERRAQGEPVAYLTGAREFFGRAFRVTPAVLIPRPETELLVERALDRIEVEASIHVLDLGTGGGCVAITIALERPRGHVVAVDVAAGALAVARENARALGARVSFVQSDWYAAVGNATFDVIVSNPPYVAPEDAHLIHGDLRFEPRLALEARDAGLAHIKKIVESAPAHLEQGGWVLVEHAFDQAPRVRALLGARGFTDVSSYEDLAGYERVTAGRLRR